MKVYCALHNCTLGERGEYSHAGKYPLVCLSNYFVEKLPDKINERDKRTLVVFDGFLVDGCLPKNAEVIYSRDLEILSVNKESVRRKRKSGVYAIQPDYVKKGEDIKTFLHRYFILLPSCTTVVFRYRPKSLSPQAVIINVEKGVARFSTSSY